MFHRIIILSLAAILTLSSCITEGRVTNVEIIVSTNQVLGSPAPATVLNDMKAFALEQGFQRVPSAFPVANTTSLLSSYKYSIGETSSRQDSQKKELLYLQFSYSPNLKQIVFVIEGPYGTYYRRRAAQIYADYKHKFGPKYGSKSIKDNADN